MVQILSLDQDHNPEWREYRDRWQQWRAGFNRHHWPDSWQGEAFRSDELCFPSPWSEKSLTSRWSIRHWLFFGYVLQEGPSRALVLPGYLGAGHELEAVYLIREQLLLHFPCSHASPQWFLQVVGVLLPKLLKQSTHHTAYGKSQRVLRLEGHPNFAHCLLNTYTCLDGAEPESLGPLQVVGMQPLGPLTHLFPEFTWLPVTDGKDDDSDIFELPLSQRPELIAKSLRRRIRSAAEKHASPDVIQRYKRLRHWKDEGGKVLWVSVKSRGAIAEGLEEFVIDWMQHLCQKRHAPLLILDGFSIQWGQDLDTELYGTTVSVVIREDLEQAKRITEGLISADLPMEVMSAVGLSLMDSIFLSSTADAYFCHQGTVQHKIGWFQDEVPGVVHSNPYRTKPGLHEWGGMGALAPRWFKPEFILQDKNSEHSVNSSDRVEHNSHRAAYAISNECREDQLAFLEKELGMKIESTSPCRQYILATSVRNEGPYLLEWIVHHLNLGFSRIIIYSNNNEDGSDALLQALQEHNFIEWRPRVLQPDESPQLSAFEQLSSELLSDESLHDSYFAWLDLDEFLCLCQHSSIDELLRIYRYPDGLSINWKHYGSNGQEFYSPELTIQRFVRTGPTNYNRHIKTISRIDPSLFLSLHNHRPIPKPDNIDQVRIVYPTPLGKEPVLLPLEILRDGANPIGIEGARIFHDPCFIAHYCLRSKEELQRKSNRGGGMLSLELEKATNWPPEFYVSQTDVNSELDETLVNLYLASDRATIARFPDLIKQLHQQLIENIFQIELSSAIELPPAQTQKLSPLMESTIILISSAELYFQASRLQRDLLALNTAQDRPNVELLIQSSSGSISHFHLNETLGVNIDNSIQETAKKHGFFGCGLDDYGKTGMAGLVDTSLYLAWHFTKAGSNYIWIVDTQTMFRHSQALYCLIKNMSTDESDLVAASLISRKSDPNWPNWWAEKQFEDLLRLVSDNTDKMTDSSLHAFLGIGRVSSKLMNELHAIATQHELSCFYEYLLPNLCRVRGLSMAEIPASLAEVKPFPVMSSEDARLRFKNQQALLALCPVAHPVILYPADSEDVVDSDRKLERSEHLIPVRYREKTAIIVMNSIGSIDQVATKASQQGWESFEKPLPLLLASLLTCREFHQPCFLDIGANTGYYSMLALILGTREIHSFEPISTIAKLFNDNLIATAIHNGISSLPVNLRQIAISNRSGFCNIYLPDNTHDLVETSSSLSSSFKAMHSNVQTIETTTLDLYASIQPSLSRGEIIIKVDVESFEPQVIEGAEMIIASHRPILVVEILPGSNSGFEYFTKFCFARDYIPLRLEKPNIVRCLTLPMDGNATEWDYLLSPKEKLAAILQALYQDNICCLDISE